MSSAGRLADACLMLQIQSCHCVESASEVCVCVCIRGEEKRLVCFGRTDHLPKKQFHCQNSPNKPAAVCFICPTFPAVIMERWPFYSAHSSSQLRG